MQCHVILATCWIENIAYIIIFSTLREFKVDDAILFILVFYVVKAAGSNGSFGPVVARNCTGFESCPGRMFVIEVVYNYTVLQAVQMPGSLSRTMH